MIIGLLLFQVISLFSLPAGLDIGLDFKQNFRREDAPFRSDIETKFLFLEYGAVVKQRKPNRWERLALALKKSGNLAE
jgi:hypothetical protein